MKNRISQIRKNNNMTQEAFAKKLNLSKNFVWMLEKGERVASDRTIADICREFNVNEKWLRTGDGEQTTKLTRNQEIAKFANDIMELPDKNIKKRLINALSKFDERDWKALEKLLDCLNDDMLESENGGE